MEHVVVGFDGSASASAALRWAAEEAGLRDAGLRVITVVGPGPDRAGIEDLRSGLTRAIVLGVGDRAFEHDIAHGDAAAHLVHACEPDDLLVVGSRGRGQLTERLLGSVSHACSTRPRARSLSSARIPRGTLAGSSSGSMDRLPLEGR